MNCVVRKIRDLCARGIIVQISMPIRKFDDDTKLLDPETFRVLMQYKGEYLVQFISISDLTNDDTIVWALEDMAFRIMAQHVCKVSENEDK